MDATTRAARTITRNCFLMLGTFAAIAIAPAALFPWIWVAVAVANAILLHEMYEQVRLLLRLNAAAADERGAMREGGVVHRLYDHSEAG